MSVRELKRVEVLAQVKAGVLTLRSASGLMGLSYRHAKRLWRRFRRRGARGLQHRHVGRRSNRRTRGLAAAGAAAGSPGIPRGRPVRPFGPTLAAEHLREEYGLAVDAETLRRWMLAAGLWHRRARRPGIDSAASEGALGELVQLDGSFEAWLEDPGPTGCLMNMVDDATNRISLRFEPPETIWAPCGASGGGLRRMVSPRPSTPTGRTSTCASPPRQKWPRHGPAHAVWRCARPCHPHHRRELPASQARRARTDASRPVSQETPRQAWSTTTRPTPT